MKLTMVKGKITQREDENDVKNNVQCITDIPYIDPVVLLNVPVDAQWIFPCVRLLTFVVFEVQ